MLKFYYHPLSPLARRVWLLLLEKQIPHEPIVVQLDRQAQFEPNFLALNPFHHVPVLVDEDLRIIESLAILEYLELRYPQPSFMPTTILDIAKMRMVQMVTVNELMPNLLPIIANNQEPLSDQVLQRLGNAWQFLQDDLGDKTYFGGDRLNLADIVVGGAIPLFHRLGISPQDYPQLEGWRQRVAARPAWQQTDPDEVGFQKWRRWLQIQTKRLARSQ